MKAGEISEARAAEARTKSKEHLARLVPKGHAFSLQPTDGLLVFARDLEAVEEGVVLLPVAVEDREAPDWTGAFQLSTR